MRFVSKRAKYSRQPWGNAYEVAGDELRRVLFMHPGESIDVALRVPSRSPFLELGLGVLLDDLPVEFEVELDGPEGSRTLLRESLASTSAWTDRRVDLSAWADREVRLTLRATGSPGQRRPVEQPRGARANRCGPSTSWSCSRTRCAPITSRPTATPCRPRRCSSGA